MPPRLIAVTAAHAPDAEAMVGATGPITFATLHRRVAAAAATLTARGVDPAPAVRATVTAMMSRAGRSGADLALAAEEITNRIAERAVEVLGTDDWQSLPGLFRLAARARPDAVALTDIGGGITYGELDRRSDDLAAALAATGAGPERLVGVAVPRTTELLVTLLAVLKTGAGYLPLDRTHPVTRLRTIVEDAAPVTILADAETVDAWTGEMPTSVITATDLLAESGPAAARAPIRIEAHSCAYVMYTSGSTGRPKGVVVTHDNVITLIAALDRIVDSSPDDVWSMFHSYAFDVSVGEIWTALVSGGRLVVLDHETTRSPDEVVEVFTREGVTIVNFTPSSFYQFAGEVRPPHGRRIPESVRRLHFSGELLDYEHVRRWQADRDADRSSTRPDADVAGPQLNNMYGPTETTVYMTRRELTREFVDDLPPSASDIGEPLDGSRVHVLDARLAPVPDGVPGELYVAGGQVTRGYLGRPGQTAGRYVADPFGPAGGRMYRTGDIGIRRAGSIEFVGRGDGQVKLRGYRIELGEVESALLAVDGVAAAGANIHRRGDLEQLVGYVVVEGAVDRAGTETSPGEHTADTHAIGDPEVIRGRVASAVPEYMVPSTVVALDRLPLTVNGKLDRAALPAPAVDRPRDAVAPATRTESTIAEVVGEVLDLDTVDVVATLFDLGGNSLSAARIAARVTDRLGIAVSARDLFVEPSVRGLATILDDRTDSGDLTPPLRPAARGVRGPLSPAQQRIWFLETLDPGGAAYLIPAVLRLAVDHGGSVGLDPTVVAAALGDLVARHEILRTRFEVTDGVPEQVVVEPAEAHTDIDVVTPIDLRGSAEHEIAHTIAQITSQGFDLAVGSPVRARLVRVTDDEWILVLVAHHIISDGGSIGPMVTDFVDAFTSRTDGRGPRRPPLTLQYADYAIWQKEVLGDASNPTSRAARQLAFWREQLAGAPELIDLPIDRPRAPVRSDAGAEHEIVIPGAIWADLRDIADRHGATVFMAVHAVLAVALARSGGTDDVVIGTPIAGRGEEGLDDLIGMFVNTLALRTPIRREQSFADLLADVREIDVAALDHADIPFESVVEDLAPTRSTAHSPLFQVALAFQNVDHPAVELPGLRVSEVATPVTTSKVDLQVTVIDPPGRPREADTRVVVTYAAALFDPGTVHALAERLVAVARSAAATPGCAVGDLEIGSTDRDLTGVVVGRSPARQPVPLFDLLGDAIAEHPRAEAVRGGGLVLTYADLDHITAEIAAELSVSGVGPGTVVALATPRSAHGTIGFWAIARSGAAPALIDPAHPAERIRHMVATVGATIGLALDADRHHLPTGPTWWALDEIVDRARSIGGVRSETAGDRPRHGGALRADVAPASVNARRSTLDDTAYVIFTSGSTGRPKGVAVPHRGLAALASDARERLSLGPTSRVLRFAAPGFDASVFETLIAVAGAASQIVVPPEIVGGAELRDLLSAEAVTHLVVTPTALATVPAADLPDLAVVCVAGDACSPDLVRHWAVGRTMLNLYGPTEATIWSTASEPMRADRRPGIGGPIAGVRAVVLDARLHPVPIGVAGELYLAGAALATGYLGQAARTAERFVADPFGAPGARMYRTGDLVRWTRGTDATDSLEFLGRSDFQIKIRGFRIEPGEIDAVLGTHPAVDFSTTAGVTHPTSGETVLVSWVHAADGVDLEPNRLSEHARNSLPSHMVPAAIVPIDRIPLATTGKLDRGALPSPAFGAGPHVAAASRTEETIARAVAETLGLVGEVDEAVSVTTSFFDLGGTSLSATRLMASIAAGTGITIPVRTLFETPTVRGLAALVDSGSPAESVALPVPSDRPVPIPVSYAQRRMWFLNQFDADSAAYVIPVVVRLRGTLDVDAMRSAVIDVVGRHEVLRTVYPATTADRTGEPVQHIVADWQELLIVDSRTVDAGSADVEIHAALTAPFDVTADLPVRVSILRIAEDEHLLVVALHHIAADGESAPVLAAELGTAYAARRTGTAPIDRPLALQYADYALWQRHRLGTAEEPTSEMTRQLTYWRDRLAGLPDHVPLPVDHARTTAGDRRAATAQWVLPAGDVGALRRLATDHRSTLFMVLHAAVTAALARITDTSTIAVATPVAGRGHADLDALIGMFVNTVVLRVDMERDETVAQYVRRVTDLDLEAFAHGEVPFERVVDAVRPPRSDVHEPLAQVMLVHTERTGLPASKIGDLDAEFVAVAEESVKFDLTVGAALRDDGGIDGVVTGAATVFEPATLTMIADVIAKTLTAFGGRPDVVVGDIPVVDADRAREISAGPVVALTPQTVADAVLAGAAIAPGAVAVRCGGRQMDHRELGARVASLARELIAQGVGPEVPVIVGLPRSVELLVAVHAVIAAGGQYIPIAPDVPADRARHAVTISGARIALLGADSPTWLPHTGLLPIGVDAGAPVEAAVTPVTDDERRSPLLPDHPVYTLFTSGSTGTPKGVTVSHRAVLNRIRWGMDRFAIGPDDAMLWKTPVTFDVSVPELFTPPVAGGCIVVADEDAHLDPRALVSTIVADQVTTVHMVPALLGVFLDEVARDPRSASSLRHLFCSGEALPVEVARRARAELPDVALHNLYGPTEAAVEVTSVTLDTIGDVVPIGEPVWNTRTYVLDDRMRPTPPGVAGELYLGGVHLARGYASRGALTAERFVADPFGSGDRLYRTGDRVRRMPSDHLQYFGRTDFQIKLRGQRIEPGEIESVLSAIPAITHAAVVPATAPGGADHLVGYLIGSPTDALVGLAESAVSDALPVYMRPTHWVTLDHAPVNSAGKLDRKALPPPTFDTDESVGRDDGPSSEDERVVAEIVAAVLGIDEVPVTTSFFTLGGDSIASIRLVSLLRTAGYDLTPRDVFATPTVRELASSTRTAGRPVLPELSDGVSGTVALPPTVSWMLSLADDVSDIADFSQSTVVTLPDEIDEPGLRSIVTGVVAAHPMLTARLRFTPAAPDAEIVAGAGDPTDIEVAIVDHPPGADLDDAVLAAHVRALGTLSPTTGRLVAAIGVRVAGGPARLVLAAHHIGVDAVSWSTIVSDLAGAWWSQRTGEPLRPTSEGTSFRRWARVLRDLAGRDDEVGFWSAQLPDPAVRQVGPGLDVDRVRDRQSTTVTVERVIDAGRTERLIADVAPGFGGRIDTVLVATLAHAVADGDAGPLSVLLENHGREEDVAPGADLAETVGWFTSLVPLTVEVPGRPAAQATDVSAGRDDAEADGRALVTMGKAVKDVQARMPDHGIAFGPLRWSRADSLLADRALPAVTVNYLGALTAQRGSVAVDDAVHRLGAFTPATDAPVLPPTITGAMVTTAALTVTVGTVATDQGRELRAQFTAPAGLLDTDALSALAERWDDRVRILSDHIAAVGDPGPSETDVTATGLRQTEIDEMLAAHPGGRLWSLTPLQQGLLFEAERATRSVDPYVTQSVLEFDGELAPDALQAAVAQLLDWNPVLRSTFVRTRAGRPVVVVPATADPDFSPVDLRDLDALAATRRVEALAAADLARPFRLDKPAPIRFTAVAHRTADGPAHSLIITAHHLIVDGWSGPILVADLLAAHLGADRVSSAAEFSAHLDWLAGRDLVAARDAWRTALGGTTPSLVAPGRTEMGSLPLEVTVELDSEESANLDRCVRSLGTTTSSAVQAAWAILVSRLTGDEQVVFGETVSGRPADLDGADTMIGLFINTIPVVADADPDRSLAALVADLHEARAGLLDHQFLGLPDILTEAGHPTLFDTLVVYESYPVDADTVKTGSREAGLALRDVRTRDATHYPLAVTAAPGDGGLALTVKADAEIYDRDAVAGIADALRSVLRSIATEPDTVIGDLDPMPPTSAAAVAGWSVGGAAVGVEVFGAAVSDAGVSDVGLVVDSVAAVVAGRVGVSPGAVAVRFGDRVVSYGEFGARVAALADELRAAGVVRGTAVGVMIPRSVELLVAIHAVVAAGGRYVPVEMDTPAERVEYMFDTAGVALVLLGAGAGNTDDADGERTELPDRVVQLLVECGGPVPEGVPSLAAVVRASGVGAD
ncbi:putative non-ribosomal peptide synthetase, partial [Gordonia soli NBRC 108243]